MIQNKLDMDTLLTAFNDIEKIKLLLFDEDQYCVFDHIQKPFIIDESLAVGNSKNKEVSDVEKGIKGKKGSDNAPKGGKEDVDDGIIVTNKHYWDEDVDFDKKLKKFSESFSNIQSKMQKNPIDVKLIELLNQYQVKDVMDA